MSELGKIKAILSRFKCGKRADLVNSSRRKHAVITVALQKDYSAIQVVLFLC